MITITILISCSNKQETQVQKQTESNTEIFSENQTKNDSIEYQDDTVSESLNDIRFKNWTEADWHDNDYFRFLRKCFDDYSKGIINEDTEGLQGYKSLLQQQFFIYKVEPFISGGLFITLGFINEPKILYNIVVYSGVDEDTKTIIGYSLPFSLRKSKETSPFTTEEILEIIRNNPDPKLW